MSTGLSGSFGHRSCTRPDRGYSRLFLCAPADSVADRFNDGCVLAGLAVAVVSSLFGGSGSSIQDMSPGPR